MKPTHSPTLLAFNKPYGVLTQFTGQPGDTTLADFIDVPNVYPAGRLDKNSEGLLLLTDDGKLQERISHPRFGKAKTYWVQVEGQARSEQLEQLRRGVTIGKTRTRPAQVQLQDAPPDWVWQRDPPVRYRKTVPDCWLTMVIREGKNRQVRRMTAAVGLPCLRLIRTRIGNISLDDLAPGAWRHAQWRD